MKTDNWSLVLILVFLFLPLNSWSQSSPAKMLKTITIQVISVKNGEKAEQELARLKSYGLSTFMRHESVRDKGMWYRIFVGQFENRAEATKFAQEIKDQGIISEFWVRQIKMSVDPEKPTQIAGDSIEEPEIKPDTAHKKPASPPAEIEMPGTVSPPKAKPSPSQPPAEKSGEQIPSSPQSPVGKTKTILPKKKQEPIPMTKKEATRISPAEDIHEKEPLSPAQGIAVQGPVEQREDNRFSLGIKSGYFLASDTKDFKIKQSDGGDQQSWSIENPKIYNSLISSYRFNPAISIEAGLERAFFTKLDVWHLNMGPKFEFRKIGMLTPYAKGSLVIGRLEWDDIPGDFDTAWGFECGLGAFITRSNIQFGLETSYRAIEYDYNRPSGDSVKATDNQIDFSGFALSGTLRYQF